MSNSAKLLKDLHNTRSRGEDSGGKTHKRTTDGLIRSSYKNDKSETYKNEFVIKNRTIKNKSYLYLRNGYINTPLKFARECLCAHNHKRRLHDTANLRWSDDLGKEAQERADELALMNINSETEIARKDENIYVDTIVDLSKSCSRAVEHWYMENRKYDYSQNDATNHTGWFTNISF